MVLCFIQLAPEIKNNYTFRDSISTTIDQNLVDGYFGNDLRKSLYFRMNDFNVPIVELIGFGDFDRGNVLFWNPTFRWLRMCQLGWSVD